MNFGFQEGYLYHIKDEFFKKVKDPNIMINHNLGKKRPTYFILREGDILWFIPLSTKVDKYRKIMNSKIKKYGSCDSIIIDRILNDEVAILIQNAFPTLEKYIDHVHTYKGVPVQVPITLKEKILKSFLKLVTMKQHGVNLFYTDIDRIKKMMIDELEKETVK